MVSSLSINSFRVETIFLDDDSSREIEIVKSILASGNSVELPATGFSMFPTLRPGDKILVRPLAKGEIPEPGRVFVWKDYGATAQRHPSASSGEGVTTQEVNTKELKDKRHASTGSADQAQVEERSDEIPPRGNKSEESKDNSAVLVMHRLLEIIDKDSDKPLFITRGDSRPEPDEPWSSEQLLGEAISYNRSGKLYQVKKFIPGFWRYKYNISVLWIRNMTVRIRKRVGDHNSPFTRH